MDHLIHQVFNYRPQPCLRSRFEGLTSDSSLLQSRSNSASLVERMSIGAQGRGAGLR
jgi:hypothetical protein